MLSRWVLLLLAHRRRSWLGVAVVAACIVAGSLRLTVELTGREFFAHRGDDVERLTRHLEHWGDDSLLLIAIASTDHGSVLTPDRVRAMTLLAREVREVPGVVNAWSLQEFPRFQESADGTVQSAILLGTPPEDPAALANWQQKQLTDPLLVPTVLSADGRHAALIIEFHRLLDSVAAIRGPVNGIENLMAVAQGRHGLNWELTGLPAIRVALLEVVFENQVVLVPASIALVVFLLWIFYKRSYAVCLPVLGGISAVILLLGVMGWTGEPIGLLNQFYFTLIPVIVMVDGVHVIERFARESASERLPGDRIASIERTYRGVGVACLMTSLTTAVGFVSLGLGNIAALKHFGLYAAIGILLGFAIVATVIPLVLACIKNTPVRESRHIAPVLRSFARVATGFPAAVCVAALAVTIALGLLANRVQAGSTLTGDLPLNASASVGGRQLDQHLSGLFRFDILLEGVGLASHDALQTIDHLESQWRKREPVRAVLGPGTAVRHASRWTEGGATVPAADPELHAQYLELLRFSELPAVVSEDGRQARIVVSAADHGTGEMIALGNSLAAEAQSSLEGSGIRVAITGTQWNLYLGYAGIGDDLRTSVFFAIGVIMFVMALMFRDKAVPFLMLPPNALPLLAGYATLALVEWQLGIVPAAVLALAVGIVVDDSIHLLYRVREELATGLGHIDAVRQAILHSGRAILISTLVLTAGFLVNAFSRFPINQTFALIGTVVLVSALICDLLVLPALLVLWHRWRGASAAGQPAG